MGSLLARALAKDHEVVVVDIKPLADRFSALDIRVVTGNVTDISILELAEAGQADAFIACTEVDEVNLIAAMLAKGLGARAVVCFVGRAYYAEAFSDPRTAEFLGVKIDQIIWPQRSMAKEVLEVILIPKALEAEEVAGGRLRLVEYRLEAQSPLVGKPPRFETLVPGAMLAGVIRQAQFFPASEAVRKLNKLEPQDHLVFIATRAAFPELQAVFAERDQVKRVTIVGGGAVGYLIAQGLERRKVAVQLVEQDSERCAWLSEHLGSTMVLLGDGTDTELWDKESLDRADALVAVTNNDEKNLLVSLLAKQLGVEKVITRVSRSENRRLFERVGIDIPLTPRQSAVREVLNGLYFQSVQELAVIEDKLELLEAPAGEAVWGQEVRELFLPKKVVVVAVLRGRDIFLNDESVKLQKGDRLIILAPRQMAAQIGERVGLPSA
jgi:trk system potassium uptake protein TrkA